MSELEALSAWSATALGDVQLYWRQIGLVSAMVLMAGLLFWRLGKRSRHEEIEGLDEGGEWAEEASLPPAIEFEQEPDAFDLPHVPAIRMVSEEQEKVLLLDDPISQPVVRPDRQHATLREAVEAMKAEVARAKRAVEA